MVLSESKMVQSLKEFRFQRSALYLLMFIYVFLQASKTGANSCKAGQYTVLKANKLHTCKDCPRCGEGFAPSPPCEGIKDVDTIVECKRCVLGETFSNDFSTEHCKFCTVCNPDQVVKRNCSLTANRVCDTKCKSIDTYYDSTVTDDCQKCSKCCGLSSDKREQECVYKAMPSDKQCNVNTATRCMTKPSTLAPSTLEYSSNEISMRPLDSTQPTITRKLSFPKNESLPTKHLTDDESNVVQTMFIVLLVGQMVVILSFFIKKMYWFIKKKRSCYKTQNCHGKLNSEDGYPLLGDKRCLSQLCEVKEYHKVCLLLECKPPEIKPECGDYTDIARHYSVPYEEICCLMDNKPGEKADNFFKLLKSRLPNLTVEEFAIPVRNINRKDIEAILINYISCK